MKVKSTRSNHDYFPISKAIEMGIAPDGGLFVPEMLPSINTNEINYSSFDNFCYKVLSVFFKDDLLDSKLQVICKNAFNFEVPLVKLNKNMSVLELFHGPTAAFKDFGARFLARCLSAMDSKKTILVATSGDTGGAVASAFHNLKNLNVVILYPKGRISTLQEKQLTCWDNNIYSLQVNGDFDDCQKIVKNAFGDLKINEKYCLTSANSINIARILPQMLYYAYTSLEYFRSNNSKPTFIIPSGNMGNSIGAFWAQLIGFPIKEISLSTNSNKVLPHYFINGEFTPSASIPTLANAMDVGNPSNFERFKEIEDQINYKVKSISVDDESIKKNIKRSFENYNYIMCPHTATALELHETHKIKNSIIISTAHPAKFADVVEPLIEQKVEIPHQLNNLFKAESNFKKIEATTESLIKFLDNI